MQMKDTFKQFSVVAAVLLQGLAQPGCAYFGTSRPLEFAVQSSALDVLEVIYAPAPENPRFRTPLRMTLFGSGSILLRRGTSPRVMDGFSADIDSPSWQDYHENRLNTSMEEMAEVFQRFVDLGLVYPIRRQPGLPASLPFPLVRVVGKIDGNPVNRIVTEPELVGLIESIIQAVW